MNNDFKKYHRNRVLIISIDKKTKTTRHTVSGSRVPVEHIFRELKELGYLVNTKETEENDLI